ncbi:MAG: ParB N-terminal domain-containing protein [Methanolobus sp.]|nr:ParB N-terminal domain-containing protein [Methanolobus sp.]
MAKEMKDLLKPVSNVQLINREKLLPNDYNPNVVSKDNLELLKQSILSNGWTMPIVIRPDFTIIDGFHRWLISGQEPLVSLLNGMVPVVIVEHEDKSKDIYGTITHNRARGQHLLEPMRRIIKDLLAEGKTVKEISKELGMKPEEIFRLSDITRDEFLKMLTKGVKDYNKAYIVKEI